MDAALQRALRETGATVTDSAVAPGSVDQVVAVVRACADAHAAIRVRSAEAAAGPDGASGTLTVSLHRMAAIDADPVNLTARCEAGALLRDVVRALTPAKLAIVGGSGIAGDAHAGAVVARGDVPRRALCGIEAVLSTGEVVRFGGVLKDVVGYDLPAMLLGSVGRLAIITSVTYRLEPDTALTPVAPAHGRRAVDSRVAAAFDPQGLLQPAS